MTDRSHHAPQHRLADLRDWLMDRIDGSEETRGDDSLISHFIRQIDALPSEIAEPRGCPTPGACSCPGATPSDPAAATPITQALVSMLEAGWLSLGSSAPGAVKPLIEALEVFERELIDIKQRLLPQFQGRAERAEKARQMAVVERDEMLEKLIVRQTTIANLHDVIDGMRGAVSSAKGEPDRPDWAQQLPGAELYDRALKRHPDAGEKP